MDGISRRNLRFSYMYVVVVIEDGQHTHRISFLGCLSEFPEAAFFAKSNSSFLRECAIALHIAPKASSMVILW